MQRKKLIVTSFTALVALLAGKKVYDYAAPPSKEKECEYVFPKESASTTEQAPVVQNVPRGFTFESLGGFTNDASCLNKTAIAGVAKITTESELSAALTYARENKLQVSIAGARHSMGGQSFIKDGLVLDMNDFDSVVLDREKMTVTAQGGATWQEVQSLLDQAGLAVKVMQSYNVFSIGGSLSVNVHGMDHASGPLSSTVRSLRIMLPSGEIKTASRAENQELFSATLGGYGLVGIILDAEIDVTENKLFRRDISYIDYKEFPAHYAQAIKNNSQYGLFFGRLSVAPNSYLQDMVLYAYERQPETANTSPTLIPEENSWVNRLVINFSKRGPIGRWTRWMLEKYIEPRFHQCASRNQLMSQRESCIVARNQEMYNSTYYLKNRLRDTDILQEYFVSPENFVAFTDGLREIVGRNHANLLNVTVRVVPQDNDSVLAYAREDMFAFVLYFNQKFTDKESEQLAQTTRELIDLATSLNGTFYLPYQLHYSAEQLRAAYPRVDEFFALKKKYDPDGLLSNTWYSKYAGASASARLP
jgi:FAD/FMN-containing dehydrogenase